MAKTATTTGLIRGEADRASRSLGHAHAVPLAAIPRLHRRCCLLSVDHEEQPPDLTRDQLDPIRAGVGAWRRRYFLPGVALPAPDKHAAAPGPSLDPGNHRVTIAIDRHVHGDSHTPAKLAQELLAKAPDSIRSLFAAQ